MPNNNIDMIENIIADSDLTLYGKAAAIIKLQKSKREWYSDRDKVLQLGYYLINHKLITDIKDLQYYYEKPWKWNDEYIDMVHDEERLNVLTKAR